MRASLRKEYPILLGCFLALVFIMAWEAASSHATYTATWETDSDSGETRRVRIRDGRWRLDAKFRGEIDITPDERAIERLGMDAYLEIEEKRGRERRRFEATPGPGGAPKIVWRVDGEAVAFDDEGQRWLARMLKKLYRVTGHDAEGRVGRLLTTGGVPEVLGEVSKISSDQIARIYFEQLLAQVDLSPDELARGLRQMAREIGSDHQMRQLMQVVPASAPADEVTARAWLAAVRSVGSDHELRLILTSYLGHADLEPETYVTLLDACTEIGGDFELAEFLVAVAESLPAGQPLPEGYIRALKTIGSDFEQRKALGAVLHRSGLADTRLDDLLETARGIGSGFELAELMSQLARGHEGELPDAFFATLATIGSDFELRKVLGAVAERPDLSSRAAVGLLEASLGIGSDHELGSLLRQVVGVHPIDAAVRPTFDRALASIGSEHERERVLVKIGS